MKIYLDLVFFMNLIYDFLILLTVGIVLKRNRRIINYFIGSIIGGVSLVLLFFQINKVYLILFKIFFLVLVVITTFGFKSLKYTVNNLIYVYMVSVILSGFLYFLNITFSFERVGIVFVFKGYTPNAILLIVLAPTILLWYIYSIKKIKSKYNLYYKIQLVFDDVHLNVLALFDSGNSLRDPVTQKPIIIVSKKIIDKINHIRSPMYVPYSTIAGSSLMECYKPSYVIINKNVINNYLIGFVEYKFSDGVDAILNVKLLEDNYV